MRTVPGSASNASDVSAAARGSARPRAAQLTALALLVLGLAAPWLGVYPVFAMNLLCFALFACAYNLLLGYTGLLSFGHAAFFGLAAYATGYAARNLGWPTELCLVAGAVAGGVLGLAMGALAIRRQGIYFAMITLALSQMVYFACLQARITGGEDGMQSIPRGTLFGLVPLGDDLAAYYTVLAVFLLAFLGIVRIVTSPFGQVLKMIRENEPRAVSLGYEVSRYKLTAFVLSAALAGLAGGMKAIVMGFATLTDVHWTMSGEVILMNLLGGVGTFLGPVVGAGVVIGLQDYLSDKVGSWVTVIIGALFMACVLAFRRGIVGEAQARLGKRKG